MKPGFNQRLILLSSLASVACSSAQDEGGEASNAREFSEARCGNGWLDRGEECDPSAPDDSTFTCADDCKARKIYDVCVQGQPFGPGDCGDRYICGGYGTGTRITFCIPAARSVADCPKISGYTWVVSGLGLECLIPCTPNGQGFPTDPNQCPTIADRCFTNPFPTEPAGWCSR